MKEKQGRGEGGKGGHGTGWGRGRKGCREGKGYGFRKRYSERNSLRLPLHAVPESAGGGACVFSLGRSAPFLLFLCHGLLIAN